MRSFLSSRFFWLLPVIVASLGVSAQQPRPQTKPSPTTKRESPPTAAARPATATLLIRADLDALISVDGEPSNRVAEGQVIKVQVGIGQHIVEARAAGTNTRWEQTVQVASAEQLVIRTELAAAQEQATALAEARRAEAAAQEALNAAAALEQRVAEAENSLLGHWSHSSSLPDGMNEAGCFTTLERANRRLLLTGERVPRNARGSLEDVGGSLTASYVGSGSWTVRYGPGRDGARCGGSFSNEIKATYYFRFDEALGMFRGLRSMAGSRYSCTGECGNFPAESEAFTAIVANGELTIRFAGGTVRIYKKALF